MRVADDAESVKPSETTVRSIVVVAVSEDDVPVIVRVVDAREAVLAAVKVRLLVVVAEPGLKAAVTPVGRPEIVSATVPLKLFTGTTVITSDSSCPRCTLRLVDEADNVKLGAGGVVTPEDELLHELAKAMRAVSVSAAIYRAKRILTAF